MRPIISRPAPAANLLRILLVVESAGAGTGRHVADLAGGLVQRGHQVALVYSPTRMENWFETHVRSVEGLQLMPIAMERGPSPRDLSSIRQLRRAIKIPSSDSYDIIHGHSSKGGALARLGALGSGAKCFYTPHALFTMNPALSHTKRLAYSAAERVLAWFTDRIICVSEFERQHALAIKLPSRKLTVINNSLSPLPPPDRGGARKSLGLEDHHFCIGFVGRLARQKAVETLLEAFASVRNTVPDARLAIVGDGPEKERLTSAASRLNIQDAVIFTGHADGPALMAAFDVFALSSNREAFPYVLLEAAARALPIVTTRVGGAEDVVSYGVNGYIVDQPAKLADHLLEIAGDPALRRSMAAASLSLAETFNVDKMVDATIACYRTTIRQD